MNDKQLKLPVSQGVGFVAAAGQIIGKAVLVEDEGTYYAVNPNAILTINCTASCNADCFFCYNRQTFMRTGTYVSAEHPCLERAIRLAHKAGIWRAGLSGGEQTLRPKELLPLAEKLKKRHLQGRRSASLCTSAQCRYYRNFHQRRRLSSRAEHVRYGHG